MILAGDIGGTKSRLAYFEGELDRPRCVVRMELLTRSHAAPADLIRTFIAQHPRPPLEAAAFGVAGPVKDGRVMAPNLPWTVDAADLADELGLPQVALLNDLQANALGLHYLADEDFQLLHQGQPGQAGHAALISAGTGLGEAGIYWDGARHRPFASEGGHADFAPQGPLQWELFEYLARRYGHVSVERVVSGPGLVNVYQFFEARAGREPAQHVGDPAPLIAAEALLGKDPVAVQAMELFISAWGAEAGNLGLRMLAVGGIYVGGGIAPKLVSKLLDRRLFLEPLQSKGRMRWLMETMPVRVVLNDSAALLGAAGWAQAVALGVAL